MINKDRVVPVKATDLISLYGTTLAMGQTFSVLDALDVEGNFDFSGATDNALASQPVKTVKINSDDENSVDLWFVPDYAYAGFIGATAVTGDEVDPDGAALYKANIGGDGAGVVKIERITPAAN